MKKFLVLFFSLIFIASCGAKHKKEVHSSIVISDYISVVENTEGSTSAYTKDGHTLICETDSNGTFVVYYAKFDDNAGKKGYDRVRDKAIRVEIDSSLNYVKGLASVYGGVVCKIDSNGIYQLHYFDEHQKDNNMEFPEIIINKQAVDKESTVSIVERILSILPAVYDIAYKVYESNIGGWSYIASALEPTQNISNFNVLIQETVHTQKAKEHISRLSSTKKVLTQLYLLYQKQDSTGQ